MENTKIKLLIGEFSKLCCVSVKTLRHYEKISLLIPEEIDKWTGYRYYNIQQMQKMLKIISFKNLGFSLEEIKDFFDRDFHEPNINEISEKISQCENDIAKLKARKKQLNAILKFLKTKDKMKEEIFIEKLPAITVATHRAVIKSWSNLGELCCNVIAPEMQRLACKCPEPGYCFSIDRDKEFKTENIDVEYCEQVTEMKEDSKIIKFKQLPEISTAVCKKCYGSYEKLTEHYREIFAYLTNEGYKIIDYPRTNYIDGIWNQEDIEKWLTIIQIPVEKI